MSRPPFTPDALDRLLALILHAKAMIMPTFGECGDSFRNLNDDIQDNYMWAIKCALCDIEAIANTITVPKVSPPGFADAPTPLVPKYQNGYHAFSVWWRDLCIRVEAANSYFVPSNLREFAQPLPHELAGDFLDSLGEMLVTWKVSGEPPDDYTNGPADVAFTKLPPDAQDAQFDVTDEPATDLARAMNTVQPREAKP